MATIKVNLTGVRTDGFEALPDGRYPCYLYELNEKTSQNDNQFFEFVFKVKEGVEGAGRQFWHNCTITPNSLWNLKRTLIALGIPAEELEKKISIDSDELVGREVVVEVINEMYDNRPVNRVKRVLPSDAPVEEAAMKVDDL
jgi:hypothetical protein